jgi:hypothetical protein
MKKGGLHRKSMEYATYRMKDGKFIESVIDALMGCGHLRYKFCFRSPMHEDWEALYAIRFVLR